MAKNKATCPYCTKSLEHDGRVYPNHLGTDDSTLCDVSGLRLPADELRTDGPITVDSSVGGAA